jgi:hypothetical protein
VSVGLDSEWNDFETPLSSEYQNRGAIPSLHDELYVYWNQLVRDDLEDFWLDKAFSKGWAVRDTRYCGIPHPLYFPVKI